MGTKGRSIVKDADKIVEKLNKAFADEWLAYYQYWVGAKVIEGPMKEAVIGELDQHAADELRHADMLALRIIQLGGVPILDPKQWHEASNCGYHGPADPNVRVVLDQNVKGEQCAIGVYTELMEFTRERDPITYNMALEILQDEVEHEEDLEALVQDFEILTAS